MSPCVLVGLASCGLECFKTEVTDCQRDWYEKHGSDPKDFCHLQVSMAKCAKDSSFKCGTGFKSEAHKVWAVTDDLCTEGTTLNNAVKSDKNCGFETFLESYGCADDMMKEMKQHQEHMDYIIANRILCKYVESMQECIYRKNQKTCGSPFQFAFLAVSRPTVALQNKICAELPAKE